MIPGASASSRLATSSAFLALQSTVRNCIPIVLPTNKAPWDVALEACASALAFGGLQRVSSDENIAASFRVKKVHLKKVTSEQIRRWESNFTFLLNDPGNYFLPHFVIFYS